jgi:asparagine synthase (glutamine-hydrolysing)
MNQCSSIKVVAPLISGELLNYALSLPSDYKVRPHRGESMEKWVFRKAFENDLPDEIVWRLKQEFSQGSGSAGELPEYFEKEISDDEFEDAKSKYSVIRSKEELYYFRIFTENFGHGKAVETVGQWLTL